MGKSYKKTPRSGQQKSRWAKKQANRQFRRNYKDKTYNHNTYRRTYSYYDICDYQTVGVSFEKYYQTCIRNWYRFGYRYEDFPNKENSYIEYKKYYINK